MLFRPDNIVPVSGVLFTQIFLFHFPGLIITFGGDAKGATAIPGIEVIDQAAEFLLFTVVVIAEQVVLNLAGRDDARGADAGFQVIVTGLVDSAQGLYANFSDLV